VKTSHGHELIFLIFSVGKEYNVLHSNLINALERYCVKFDPNNIDDEDNDHVAWIAPALLILDFFSQSLLVDTQLLSTSISDFELYQKAESTFEDIFNYRRVLSVDVEKTICEMYSLKPGRNKMDLKSSVWDDNTKSILFPKSNATDDKKVTDTEIDTSASNANLDDGKAELLRVELPLFENGLTKEQKFSCVTTCGLLVSQINSCNFEKAAKFSIVCHACFQLLIHLTRSNSERDLFQSIQGAHIVLRCTSYFDGLPKFVFSIIQQLVEDQTYLSVSIAAAIRLCLSRLSYNRYREKTPTSKVPFKTLVEAITPLLYRDQRLVLSILQDSTEFQQDSDGQIYVRFFDKSTPHPTEKSRIRNGASKRLRDDELSWCEAIDSAESNSSSANLSSDPVESTLSAKKQKTTATEIEEKVHLSLSASETPVAASLVQTAPNDLRLPITQESYMHVSPLMQDVVEEVITQIVVKWIIISKSIVVVDENTTRDSTWLSELKTIPTSTMSISNLLVLLSDLVSSLPAFAICVLRFQLKKLKALKVLESIMHDLPKFLPIIHAVTGKPLTAGLFTTFLVHSLLLSNVGAKRSPKVKDPNLKGGATLTDETSNVGANIPDCDAIAGSDMRDSCCYLIAALASRPGI